MARPRYLAVGCCGMAAPFRVTDGDVPGLREKVMHGMHGLFCIDDNIPSF